MFNGLSQGLAARKQNDSSVIYIRYLQYSQRRAPRMWLRVKALVPRVTVPNPSLHRHWGGGAGGARPTGRDLPAPSSLPSREAAPAPALRWTGRRCRGAAAAWLAERVPRRPRHPQRLRGLRVAPRSSPRRPARQTPAPRPSRGPGLGAAATGPGAPAAGRPSVRGHGARGHGLPAPPDGSGLLICISEPPPGQPVPAPRRPPPPPPPPGEGTR